MSHEYLYCLLRPLPGHSDQGLADLLGQLKGVCGPLHQVQAGGELLVFSTHDASEIMQTRRNMLAHTRVLEALMETGTVLPMRFGMVSKGLERVARLIEERRSDIDAQFSRLQGHVELGLRIAFPRDAALARLIAEDHTLIAARDALDGRGNAAYYARIELGRRVADALDRRRGAAQKRVLARLVPLAATHVLRAPEADVEVLRAEFLVPRAASESFAAAAVAAAETCGFAPGTEPAIQIVGPVPPYHFVNLVLAPVMGEAAA